MAVIAVGGHSHNIGKTSVVAGLISALADRNWTAIIITRHNADICPVDGPACACGAADHQQD